MTSGSYTGTSDSSLLTAYNSLAAASITGPTILLTINVPIQNYYDTEAICWNSGTAGQAATDDLNIGLYIDGTMERLISWPINAVSAGTPFFPVRTRVLAESTIQLRSLGAAFAGTVYTTTLAVTLAIAGDYQMV
jgi:hypothetical protein